MPRLRAALVNRQEQAGYVTVAEAARRAGVCERTIRAWSRSGSLKTHKVGPTLVFVDAASLAAATGGAPAGTDAEILAEVYERTKPARPAVIRELTFERDE